MKPSAIVSGQAVELVGLAVTVEPLNETPGVCEVEGRLNVKVGTTGAVNGFTVRVNVSDTVC